MRDLPGVHDISKPDRECNKEVKRIIDLAKLPVDKYILAVTQELTVEEAKRLEEKKEYIVEDKSQVEEREEDER